MKGSARVSIGQSGIDVGDLLQLSVDSYMGGLHMYALCVQLWQRSQIVGLGEAGRLVGGSDQTNEGGPIVVGYRDCSFSILVWELASTEMHTGSLLKAYLSEGLNGSFLPVTKAAVVARASVVCASAGQVAWASM